MPVLVSDNKGLYSKLSFRFVMIPKYNLKRSISPEKLCPLIKQNKNRYRSASLTAETAMALPLFFFSIYIFWQCFLLLLVQMSVCREVAEVTLTNASLGYVERETEEMEDLSWLYEGLIWKALLSEERIESVFVSLEKGENGKIQGRLSYDFLCGTALLPEMRIPVVQSFCFRPYIGEYDKDALEKKIPAADMVYVTKYGTVYHTVKSCGYLSVEVRAVKTAQLENLRNSHGKRYSACDVCAKGENLIQVYVSAGGIKYHTSVDCVTLKRAIEEKKREEVSLPACSRCAKKDNGA